MTLCPPRSRLALIVTKSLLWGYLFKHFDILTFLVLIITLGIKHCYPSCFKGKETGAQRGEMTCSKSKDQLEGETGIESRSYSAAHKPHVFS